MIKLFLIISYLIVSNSLTAQEKTRFDRYIDSLLGVNKQIEYKDILKFQNLKYDSINKENNIGFWIEACFKKLGIEAYLNGNSIFVENGMNINMIVTIDTLGFVTQIKVDEKKVAKFVQKKLIGTNFFKDYIEKIKVNGICISKVDEEFYKNYFQYGTFFPLTFGESNSNSCNCGTK